MIHLIVGPDHLLVERRIREILDTADPDRLNSTRLDKSASLGEVSGAVATAGFFGTGRVIIAEGVLARASGTGKAKKAEADEIAALFSAVAPGNTLILVDTALHSIPASVRALKGHQVETYEGKPPRGHELVAWVNDEVARQGGRIERRAVNSLLDLLFPGDWTAEAQRKEFDNPPDLQTLVSEVAKLVTAANGAEITVAMVTDLVRRETQEQLFPVIDAVSAGNVRGALTVLGTLGEDDDLAARVVNQLAANAEIAPIAVGLRGEADRKDVAAQTGLSPARLGTVQRNFTAAQAAALADVVLESDRRLKTGITRNPGGQLYDILLKQANKTRDR